MLVFQFALSGFAQQTNQTSAYKIVVFAPIFIDSAFNGNTYKVTGNSLPKTILPGLDFYNGVMMAVDSLQKEKANIEVIFYDTKSATEPMNKVLSQKVWDSVSLIIASFKDRQEIKPLADFALSKKIPLISATFPNEGGVSNNPYFVLLNSTLKTHCEGIYKFIQKNYSTSNLVYIKRKGKIEDDILGIFSNMGKTTPAIPLKYKTIELSDTFTTKQLQAYLDSTKQNVVICGTINETFGIRLVKALHAVKKYPAVAIGMPTWDGIKEFNRAIAFDEVNKGVEIIYSTPYHFSRTEKLGKSLVEKYKDKYFARASDWFLKGYESMYYFSTLLVKYNKDFLNHLSDADYRIFNAFDIQPVLANKENTSPNFLENKKLYFVKKQDGVVKSVY